MQCKVTYITLQRSIPSQVEKVYVIVLQVIQFLRTLSFSRWNAGLRILLCLTHFSPSWLVRPSEMSFVRAGNWGFSKWPNLLESTSLTSAGSVMVTLGIGPNQEKHVLPCSRTLLWRNGVTRGTTSWHPSGSGLAAQASLLRRPNSVRSPVRKR